jgi:predicted transcriptional regulator
MRNVTVKLPDDTLERLKNEAQTTGRTVGAIIRDLLESSSDKDSVHVLTSDLAGSLAGPRKSVTNARRRFRRS